MNTMKKFFKQKINFPLVVLALLVLVSWFALAEGATPPPAGPSALAPLIHKGGGDQVIDNLRIGCPNALCAILSGAQLDTRGSQSSDVSLFDNSWTNSNYKEKVTFRVLQNATFATSLFLGGTNTDAIGPGLAIWKQNYAGKTPAQYLQRVNVWGTALSVPLSHNKATPQEVCITRDGTLVPCPTAQPVNGVCNAAIVNGGPYNNPPTGNLCTSGIASGIMIGASSYSWTCFGQNGGSNQLCTTPRVVPEMAVCGPANGVPTQTAPTTGLCSVGTASAVNEGSSSFTWSCTSATGDVANCLAPKEQVGYYWDWGPYGQCVDGIKTRNAICKDSNGNTHDDQVCIVNVGPKPAPQTTTEGCNPTFSGGWVSWCELSFVEPPQDAGWLERYVISGAPNQTIHYMALSNPGHAASGYTFIRHVGGASLGIPRYQQNTGTFKLDATGKATVEIQACGGTESEAGNGDGDSSASLTLYNALGNPFLSTIIHGRGGSY